jgi:hypothetical protein
MATVNFSVPDDVKKSARRAKNFANEVDRAGCKCRLEVAFA